MGVNFLVIKYNLVTRIKAPGQLDVARARHAVPLQSQRCGYVPPGFLRLRNQGVSKILLHSDTLAGADNKNVIQSTLFSMLYSCP